MKTYIIPVPKCRQATSYTCGPAALQCVLGYYLDEYQEDYLSKELHSIPIHGTDFRDILRLCHFLSYEANFYEYVSIDKLKDFLVQGLPVILMIQAWADTSIDYRNSWDNGHYVVACGYSDTSIIFMDPSTLGSYTYIPTNELINRWHLKDHYDCYYQGVIVIRSTKTSYRYTQTHLKYIG
ncbi:C39 family peptidase [Anaerosporobacter sp.]